MITLPRSLCSRGPHLTLLISLPFSEAPGEDGATAPGEGTHSAGMILTRNCHHHVCTLSAHLLN